MLAAIMWFELEVDVARSGPDKFLVHLVAWLADFEGVVLLAGQTPEALFISLEDLRWLIHGQSVLLPS